MTPTAATGPSDETKPGIAVSAAVAVFQLADDRITGFWSFAG